MGKWKSVRSNWAQAEAGGSGSVSRRVTGQQSGADQFVMKIPNNKVGLVIGKGGETIKSMQARTDARIQGTWDHDFPSKKKMLGLFFASAHMILYSIAWAAWVPYAAALISVLTTFALPCALAHGFYTGLLIRWGWKGLVEFPRPFSFF